MPIGCVRIMTTSTSAAAHRLITSLDSWRKGSNTVRRALTEYIRHRNTVVRSRALLRNLRVREGLLQPVRVPVPVSIERKREARVRTGIPFRSLRRVDQVRIENTDRHGFTFY